MATQLSNLPLPRLRQLLVAAERTAGADSVSAMVIREAIAAKQQKAEKRKGANDAK